MSDAFVSAAQQVSGNYFSFKEVGDSITLQVTRVSERPSVFKGQPRTIQNGPRAGEQIMEQVIEGLDVNAASAEEAAVIVTVDKVRQRRAIGDAILEAGASSLQVGGTLEVTFTGYGVGQGSQPPKEFSANYWLPEPEGDWTEEDEG